MKIRALLLLTAGLMLLAILLVSCNQSKAEPTATYTLVQPTLTSTPLPPTSTVTPIPPTTTNTQVPPTPTYTPISPTVTHTSTPTPIIIPKAGAWKGKGEVGIPYFTFEVFFENGDVAITNFRATWEYKCHGKNTRMNMNYRSEVIPVENGVFEVNNPSSEIGGTFISSSEMEGYFHFFSPNLCELETDWTALLTGTE
jgi:hypothetical protein